MKTEQEIAQAQAEVSKQDEVQMDEFGRTDAERTTMLSSAAAEAVNVEVERGKHATYEDALDYIISRGLAELKRTRDAQEKTKQAKVKANAMDKLSELLALNPALVSQPEAMAKIFATLGIKA